MAGRFDFAFLDTVDVRTQDGAWHEGLKAQVQRDKVLLLETDLPIREGDALQRKLSSGVVEEYTIEHVHVQVAVRNAPSITTLNVRKHGSVLHERQRGITQNIYNLTGENPRVNVNSVDKSVNVLTVNSETLFSDLSKAIREQVSDAQLRDQLAEVVQKMDETRGTSDYTANFQSFMALAANCMTVVMPFLPALGQLLK